MAKHRQPEPTAPPSPATAEKEKEAQRKRARPLPVFFWETVHVMKWMKRCCINHYTSYSTLFLDHEITGRSLVRLNDVSLEKMGIKDPIHRDELYREILKLKLKSNILEMRDLESKGIVAVLKKMKKIAEEKEKEVGKGSRARHAAID